MAISLARKDEIWGNLLAGASNTDNFFGDRRNFDVMYNYASKSAEEKAVLDAFWNNAKSMIDKGQSAYQAISALKSNKDSYINPRDSQTPEGAQTSTGGGTVSKKQPITQADSIEAGNKLRAARNGNIPLQSLVNGMDPNSGLYQALVNMSNGEITYPTTTTGSGTSYDPKDTNQDGTVSQVEKRAAGDFGMTPAEKERAAALDVERVNAETLKAYEEGFDKTWNAYIEAQKQVYGIETAQGLQKYQRAGEDLTASNYKTQLGFDWQGEDLNRRNAQDLADYQKFTGREQVDFNRQLATRNKDFSNALTNAANAYGQKGILRSGVAAKKSAEAVSDFSGDTAYLKLQEQNKMEDAATAMARTNEQYNLSTQRLGTQRDMASQDYATQTKRLGEDKNFFESAQSAKVAAGIGQLQTQGDTIYNQGILQKYQLEQEQNKQAALDKLYGRTPQPTRIRFRSGGQYSY